MSWLKGPGTTNALARASTAYYGESGVDLVAKAREVFQGIKAAASGGPISIALHVSPAIDQLTLQIAAADDSKNARLSYVLHTIKARRSLRAAAELSPGAQGANPAGLAQVARHVVGLFVHLLRIDDARRLLCVGGPHGALLLFQRALVRGFAVDFNTMRSRCDALADRAAQPRRRPRSRAPAALGCAPRTRA